MKISHDIRDQAERNAGLAAQAETFRATGSKLYQDI
jgi:hypothetical protein